MLQELGLFLSLVMTFFARYSSNVVEQLLSQALCLSDLHFKLVVLLADLETSVVSNRFTASSTRELKIGWLLICCSFVCLHL